jgi:hypothetical protein
VDDKGGTVIHEMSHFTVVGGTDDVTYGESSCRDLADTDPGERDPERRQLFRRASLTATGAAGR